MHLSAGYKMSLGDACIFSQTENKARNKTLWEYIIKIIKSIP